MGLEDVASMISDVAGDFSEGIQDMAVEIGDFSQNAIESLGEDGVEALEDGDFKEAVDCSDMPEQIKEGTKEVLTELEVPGTKQLWMGAAKVAGGTLGAIAALATPGFQPAGLAAMGSVIMGAKDLASGLSNRQVNIVQANA